MNTSTKKIIYMDASTLKDSACLKKVWFNNIKGFKRKGEEAKNFKAAYGTAVHKALELYYCGRSVVDCIKAAIHYYNEFETEALMSDWSNWLHTEHLRQTLTLYFLLHPLGECGIDVLKDGDGKPILEQKFCLPYWSNDEYELALTGIIDMQCNYFGTRSILDHKTHSLTMFDGKNPVKKFLSRFKMNVQTQFYSMIDKLLNKRSFYLPVVVNGFFMKKPTEKAAKAGVFDGVLLERGGPIEYSDAQMHEFANWLEQKLALVTKLLSTTDPEKAFFNTFERSCCDNYGGCKYYGVCETSDLTTQYLTLGSDFDTVEYNPLKWRE